MRRFALFIVLAAPLTAQSPLISADSALTANQPWRATLLLNPLLASPATRTPEALLLAARAAAAWEGWPTVRRLLERESWLDSQFDRLGRRLLAEADLAEFHNPQAVVDATAATGGSSSRARRRNRVASELSSALIQPQAHDLQTRMRIIHLHAID